jgi:hypothetical protein
LPTFVVVLTAGYAAAGLLAFAAWQLTGNDAWVEQFFELPGAVLLVMLAGIELALSLRVMTQFSPGQLMHTAWKLIAFSAGCDMAGAIASQFFGKATGFRLLRDLPWRPDSAETVRQFGLLLGGPFRFALLAAGLFLALRVYRQSGFLARLAARDWVLLAGVGLYIAREARDLIVAIQHGKHPRPEEIMGWPVDPLLWLLLAEALLLHRSVRLMGAEGCIGRCWRTFSAGIALVALGDVAIWAASYGYLPWPWSSVEWYIWFAAAGAFALAPAYQMDAVRLASAARNRASVESVL